MFRGELAGGGAMMDIGLHVTDLVRFVAGEVEAVYGRCSEGIWKVDGSEDGAMAIFETVDGIPVVYQATWTEWTGENPISGEPAKVTGTTERLEDGLPFDLAQLSESGVPTHIRSKNP